MGAEGGDVGIDEADDERATSSVTGSDKDDFCRLVDLSESCNWSVPETVSNWSFEGFEPLSDKVMTAETYLNQFLCHLKMGLAKG